jgi:hypothetical protein
MMIIAIVHHDGSTPDHRGDFRWISQIDVSFDPRPRDPDEQ